MNKLLVICGPTATGKTALALRLANMFNGELISADSRQVYRDMDIGTGKDVPPNTKIKFPVVSLKKQRVGCYEVDGVKIWGYDLVGPKDGFSVSQYLKVALEVAGHIWEKGKVPVLVGGTGLYIKGLINGVDTSDIPPDSSFRRTLADKSSEELFELLAAEDPIKSASMNMSDKKNPRRLIRALEVAKYSEKIKGSPGLGFNTDILWIGLTAPMEVIKKNIEERVRQRLELGLEDEISKLLSDGVDWDDQSMQTLGYKEWKNITGNPIIKNNNDIKKEDVITNWITDEVKYAKRQVTWFKTEKRVNWFDISDKDWKKAVEKMVKKWQNG